MDITINGSAYYALDTTGIAPINDTLRNFKYSTN